MTTQSKIEFVRNQVGDVPHKLRCVYSNGMALRALLIEKENQILIELGEHPAPQPLHIPNSTNHPFTMLGSKAFMEYAANKLALELLESTPLWKEAHGTLQLLVDELAALEIQLAAEIEEKGRKQLALREAEEVALEAARKAAESDPAVVAARDALARLDQPVTSKGKRQPAEVGEVS